MRCERSSSLDRGNSRNASQPAPGGIEPDHSSTINSFGSGDKAAQGYSAVSSMGIVRDRSFRRSRDTRFLKQRIDLLIGFKRIFEQSSARSQGYSRPVSNGIVEIGASHMQPVRALGFERIFVSRKPAMPSDPLVGQRTPGISGSHVVFPRLFTPRNRRSRRGELQIQVVDRKKGIQIVS